MSIDIGIIRQAILEIRRDGRSIDDLEAFLIHPDDLMLLLDNCKNSYQEIARNYLGEIFICGVKIITNPHIPSGTIFKVFKTDAQNRSPYIPQSIYGERDKGKMFDSYRAVVDKKEKKTKKNRCSKTRKIELG